jgi:hypothetical protein
MASIRVMIVGWVHQRGTAASAGSGFDAYRPPLASLPGSDGCHPDVLGQLPLRQMLLNDVYYLAQNRQVAVVVSTLTPVSATRQ